MFTPYDFQDKAVADARAAIAAGKRRVIIVAPTGSGKTVMAAMITELARNKDKLVLFLANRRELVFQAQRTIESTGLTTGRGRVRPWGGNPDRFDADVLPAHGPGGAYT